mmetsp:Transcript_31345/g.43484  ORF Transcript_31345/g.43484 Transcript_31345/m.43484 type:complete len:248 (+) Transcript_31345:182-925(+)
MSGKNEIPRLIPLPYGCTLFKNWVSLEEQQSLIKFTTELATKINKNWKLNADAQEHPYIFCSFDKNPGKRANDCVRSCGLRSCTGACGRPTCEEEPTTLYSLASNAFARAKSYAEGHDDETINLPDIFNPVTAWGLTYKERDVMASHLDRAEGWTLSISVGADVDFVIGRKPEKDSMYGGYAPHKPYANQIETPLQFCSGDMLLFEGDKVFHAVDGIKPNSAPNFWKNSEAGVINFARIGILFRDGH